MTAAVCPTTTTEIDRRQIQHADAKLVPVYLGCPCPCSCAYVEEAAFGLWGALPLFALAFGLWLWLSL
jgi:hypothetical protein